MFSLIVGDTAESHTVFFVESLFLSFLLLNISGIDLGILKQTHAFWILHWTLVSLLRIKKRWNHMEWTVVFTTQS
jgi:hypothetical protein